MPLCGYGCGRDAKFPPGPGISKWCCEDNYRKCKNVKQKKSEKMKIFMSNNNPMKGKRHKKETIEKFKIIHKGRTPWNKGKIGLQTPWNKNKNDIYSKETLEIMKMKAKNKRLTLIQIKEKYPTFSKVEEIRYNPNKCKEKELQVHCKNNTCPNSKENGGWFTPDIYQFINRRSQLEFGNEGSYFYCSQKCKDECILYNKTINQLIKEDQIRAGHIPEKYYTTLEIRIFNEFVMKRENYLCEYCGEKAEHVHHIYPKKLYPGYALDPDHGLACCEKCHYKYGHPKGTECSTGNISNKICIK